MMRGTEIRYSVDHDHRLNVQRAKDCQNFGGRSPLLRLSWLAHLTNSSTSALYRTRQGGHLASTDVNPNIKIRTQTYIPG
jgi:hypothetical protein